MRDNATYGFNRSDTNALLDLISTNDIEHEEIKPIGGGSGGGATQFYRYVLTTDMSEYLSGRYSAQGNVQKLDVTNTTTAVAVSGSNVTVYDPIGVAAHQIENDEGICVAIGTNRYVVLEPQCTFAFPPGSSGGGGTIPISPSPIVP
jgi:hypothetical protein